METRGRWHCRRSGPAGAAHPALQAADFELTPAEPEQLTRGETVIRANLDAGPAARHGARGHAHRRTARRGVPGHDPVRGRPEITCRTCAPAAAVPAPDDSRHSLVEHEVDFGWYAPRLKYVFRADLVARPEHRLPPGQRRFQGQRRHLGIRAGRRAHPAAIPRATSIPRVTCPTGWRAPRSSGSCRRCSPTCSVIVRRSRCCAPTQTRFLTDSPFRLIAEFGGVTARCRPT